MKYRQYGENYVAFSNGHILSVCLIRSQKGVSTNYYSCCFDGLPFDTSFTVEKGFESLEKHLQSLLEWEKKNG